MPLRCAHRPHPTLHESFGRGVAPFPNPTLVGVGLHLGSSLHRALTGHAGDLAGHVLQTGQAGVGTGREELTVRAVIHVQECSRAFIYN